MIADSQFRPPPAIRRSTDTRTQSRNGGCSGRQPASEKPRRCSLIERLECGFLIHAGSAVTLFLFLDTGLAEFVFLLQDYCGNFRFQPHPTESPRLPVHFDPPILAVDFKPRARPT